MKYDAEKLMTDIRAILVAKLDAKLDQIAAEKADFDSENLGGALGLPYIPEKDYFFQSWSDRILNVKYAIFYGIEETVTSGMGPSSAVLYKIFVEIIVHDSGQDSKTTNRVLRYSRAIREVFEENYDKLPGGNNIKIETTKPISFRIDLDTSEEIKVGGVLITTAFA